MSNKTHIQLVTDDETKEKFKKAIKKQDPHLVSGKNSGYTPVLLRFIHKYIKEANLEEENNEN